MKISANIALTLDGRIAGIDPRQRLGSKLDLQRMKSLRADADAVLVGGRTFRDWPLPYGGGAPLINAVLTNAGVGAHIATPLQRWSDSRVRLIVLTSTKNVRDEKIACPELEVVSTPTPTVAWALSTLEGLVVDHVLCEGGGALLGELIALKRLNRLYVTICPKLLGEGALLFDGAVGDVSLQILNSEKQGDEIFVSYQCTYLPEE